MQYWEECMSEALYEAEVNFTPEQLAIVVDYAIRGHEMYDEYTGRYLIPNPETERANRAEKALQQEQRKIFCCQCNGRGRIYTQGPYHGSDSECWKCRGEGKHLP